MLGLPHADCFRSCVYHLQEAPRDKDLDGDEAEEKAIDLMWDLFI